jgi:hypothetical protein
MQYAIVAWPASKSTDRVFRGSEVIVANDLPRKVNDASIRRDAASILRLLLSHGPCAIPLEHHPNSVWKLISGRYIVGGGFERVGRQSKRLFRIVDRGRAQDLLAELDAELSRRNDTFESEGGDTE